MNLIKSWLESLSAILPAEASESVIVSVLNVNFSWPR